MSVRQRTRAMSVAFVLAVIVTPLALAPTQATARDHADRADHAGDAESAQVVLDWERISMQTVYPATPVPTGVPLLGFTSVAMLDAVNASGRVARSSETAAAATAAHDVLVHYFPATSATLDAHLATTLATVTDVDARMRGELIGSAAASRMLASRVGDGYGNPDIHYALPAAVGTWQPAAPATDMLGAWLGSLRPLVLRRSIRLNGPDSLTSRAYATDYREVKRLGGTVESGTERTQAQTDTALFFNSNSATMVGDALVRHLETAGSGLSLADTALLFAEVHAAMTDSVIQAWRLKRDIGFWRPSEAIAGAGLDGNPATTPQAGWAPLVPNPPYSDYVSGHASLTAPAVEVIRRTLGERTALTLVSANSVTPRTYPTLGAIEHHASHARIWSGLHFRDAMVDGYRLGHRTARRVMAVLD